MPTIDQLAPATASSDSDELIVNQSGVTLRATRAQILAGVQPELALPSGSVLGRASTGVGIVETLTVGANLVLSAGTLSAVASSYAVAQLPAGTVPAAADLIPLGQGGINTAVPLAQFANGLMNVGSLNASALLVQPTGSGITETLGALAAGVLMTAGGTISGSLTLAAAPTAPRGAATKQYVDNQANARAGGAACAGGNALGCIDFAGTSDNAAQRGAKAVCRRGYGIRAVADGRYADRSPCCLRQPIGGARRNTERVRRWTVRSSPALERGHVDRCADVGWGSHRGTCAGHQGICGPSCGVRVAAGGWNAQWSADFGH